jgi:hypothetical protein
MCPQNSSYSNYSEARAMINSFVNNHRFVEVGIVGGELTPC